jgi:hypothetical protein
MRNGGGFGGISVQPDMCRNDVRGRVSCSVAVNKLVWLLGAFVAPADRRASLDLHRNH